MTDITLDTRATALLIADFYADQMSSLPHAVTRKCVENTMALQRAARRAGLLVCYSATVFRAGHLEISDRNKMSSLHKRSGRPPTTDPKAVIHPDVKPGERDPVVGKHRANAF